MYPLLQTVIFSCGKQWRVRRPPLKILFHQSLEIFYAVVLFTFLKASVLADYSKDKVEGGINSLHLNKSDACFNDHKKN